MYYFEVCEIGRESVKSVNASILATLIKELVSKYEKNHKFKLQHRRYYIRCKEKLEFTPKKHKKIGDDEGFESDANEEDSLSGELSNEDAQSTTSSCCLIDDHVFKTNKMEMTHRNSYGRDPTSLVSIIGSIDSANSSGSSDTDELDMHSLTPSPVSQSKKQLKNEYLFEMNDLEDKKLGKNKKEEYPIADVIFCHTEPKYPTVIAWVIKRHQSELDYGSRLGITGVEFFSKMENCLEVIVVKCKNNDNLRELCSNYQEYSRRIKLDHYKSIKRKKDDEKSKSMSLSPLIGSKEVKVSLSDMKVASSGLIKASELSILNPKIMTSFKTDLKNSVSLNSLIKPEQNPSQGLRTGQGQGPKSPTGPPPGDVKKTQSLMNLSKTWDFKSDGLSRTRNGDLGDQFNLIQRTDLNGVTHLEVSKTRDNKTILTNRSPSTKSKLRKEIEGVILTDVESYAKKEQIRQRQGLNDGGSVDKIYETPPIRPERRKKKTAPTSPSENVPQEQKPNTFNEPKSKSSFYLAPQQNENLLKKDQKVLKGPYVRVQSWGNQNLLEPSLNGWRTEPKNRHVSKYEEKYVDRRRSKSAGRAVKKTPMAYRYVDITNDYRGNSPMKCDAPQRVREVGGNLTNTVHSIRRRNSFDDVIAFNTHNKGNLKSVIKKSKKINDKYCEPKKVTFSAFATVQVVD